MTEMAVSPWGNRKYFTSGVWALVGLALIGLGAAGYRFVFGLSAATNLTNGYPWGLWIGIDVATGVALAAGGFTTAFLAHIIHRKEYHVLVRPALLTALLGYTFVALGLLVDLGRYYNVWHPMLPSMWQGDSALFEVGMCVMLYLTVLYIEFIPVVAERFERGVELPGLLHRFNGVVTGLFQMLNRSVRRVMFIFIISGVVLSCMHQSSLGALMTIVPSKLHPLWHSPILALLFLLSAFAVGFPIVIFESVLASRSFRLKPENKVLSSLGQIVSVLLGIYLAAKLIDMVNRGTYIYLDDGSPESISFLLEMIGGVVAPMVIFSVASLRKKISWLFTGATLVVLGVALNRYNVFILGFKPVYAEARYIPAWTEIFVTIGLISSLVLVYRFLVMKLPVIHGFGGYLHE